MEPPVTAEAGDGASPAGRVECLHAPNPAHHSHRWTGLAPFSPGLASQAGHALKGRLELTFSVPEQGGCCHPGSHSRAIGTHRTLLCSALSPSSLPCPGGSQEPPAVTWTNRQHNDCCLGSGFSSSVPCVQFLWRGFPQGASSCIYPTKLLAGRRRSWTGWWRVSFLMPHPRLYNAPPLPPFSDQHIGSNHRP